MRVKPDFSIIIASSCSEIRGKEIRRALRSVSAQDVACELLFVANGANVCQALLAQVREFPGVRSLVLQEGNVSKARFAGVQAARGTFWCFLDDDDELLPGALRRRLEMMRSGVDVLATNGWVRQACGYDVLLVSPGTAARIDVDPVGAFLASNWFASTGPVFRAETVTVRPFDMDRRYFEWTLLFFELVAAGLTFGFDDEPSFVKYENHGGSVSASRAYLDAYLDHLDRLLASRRLMSALTAAQIAILKAKRITALNQRALGQLEVGNLQAAWRAHARCVLLGGWRYLPFTRKLLRLGGLK